MDLHKYTDGPARSYAAILRTLSSLGLVLLVAGFILYGSGILPSSVSPKEATGLWHHSAAEYAEAAGLSGGWSWIRNLGQSDMISFASLALLAGVSIPALAALTIIMFRRKDPIYGAIALLQVLVLLIAASGFLTA